MATLTLGVTTISTANATSYASASFTPAASDLLVAFVEATDTVATGTMTSSVAGQTFTKVNSGLFQISAGTVYAFIADVLSTAVAQTVTFDCTGDAASGADISVFRVGGMTVAGSSAIVQSAIRSNQVAGSAVIGATFGATPVVGNPQVFALANVANPPTLTAGNSWVEVADTGHATPTGGLWVAGLAAGSTTTVPSPAGTGTTSGTAWGAVLIELAAVVVDSLFPYTGGGYYG